MREILPKLLFLLLMASPFFAQAQTEQDSIWQKKYERRILKKRINGIYIPQNLGDAHLQLNKLISPEARQKFKNMTEDQVRHKLFFSFGRWITVNWNFYEGSRLSHSLRKLGVSYPEDMAEFVMITYHRKLNRRPFDAKTLIEEMVAKRKKAWEKRHQVIILPRS